MVIPSLGDLGLTIGHGDFIRVSANGKLILESQIISEDLYHRVLRAVAYEIDKNIFQFLEIIKKYYSIYLEEFIDINLIDAPSKKQKKERIWHWLSILQQVELINYNSEKITINEENYRQTLEEVNVDLKNIDSFETFLLDSYFKISKDSAGVLDIADLRKEVAIRMLMNNLILTEGQFDEMLKKIPFETKDYIISFGKPMGAGEKLFKYKENYFRTIFIKVRKM